MLTATRATLASLGNLTMLSSLMTPSAAGSSSSGPTKPICSESPRSVGKGLDRSYGTLPRRRRPSTSYGNMFNLRPRSPPLSGRQSQHTGLRLSPGKYIEDTPLDFYADAVSPAQSELMQTALSADLVGGKAEAGPPVPSVWARLHFC